MAAKVRLTFRKYNRVYDYFLGVKLLIIYIYKPRLQISLVIGFISHL